MRIVLTGGGTGGHLTPLEPIIEALRQMHLERKGTLPKKLEPDTLDLSFLGIVDTATRDFFAHFDVAATHIPSGKLRRYVSSLTIIDLLFRLPLGIVKALWHVWLIMPDVVVSKGGYGSFPVVVAARFYRIPILLHESDAVMGLANRRLAGLASAIAVGFAATRERLKRWQYKTIVTGTPIRRQFSAPDRTRARSVFGLAPDATVLFVFGGSQGAQQINELLLAILPALVTEYAIIHITGKDHFLPISTVAEELLQGSPHREKYKVFGYLTDTMDEAMAAADVIIARSGATSISEIAHVRKAALLIPLAQAAGDHQRENASLLESAGAARVLDPANLSKHLFERNIRELLGDPKLRQQLAANLAQFDYPAAARDIAEITFKLISGLVPQRA
jgi:UDP-N-acetylglucosamine--N-acetylmuramyl-(pentapeptide) pyrophosphoryl-undecaprenol N-acetylglucosamine transferase